MSKYRNNIYQFLIYVSLFFVILSILSNSLYKKTYKVKASIVNSNINYNDEKTYINANYPRFKDEDIDKIITNYIYNYIKKFKLINKNKELIIDFEIYYYDNNYINIVFNIKNSLENIKYKNIFIDLNKKKQIYICNLYDKNYLESKMNELAYYKYSEEIYNLIKKSNVNNHTYLINDNKIDIYFNDIHFNNINYIPYITINLNENVSNNNYYKYDKYIAFTFDDGPSNYTSELLKSLELNDSSATFFMLGNKMKHYKETVLEIYNSNSEVGMHSYSHKNLTLISNDDIRKEINSTEIIYNEITNDKIKYLRPPYGSYNDNIIKLPYTLILWNIDTKDWLYKDSTKIYNNIIKNACDGCIVLMHDTSIETIEAVKKTIPVLNELGYNVVSIDNLINAKKYDISNNQAIRKIK